MCWLYSVTAIKPITTQKGIEMTLNEITKLVDTLENLDSKMGDVCEKLNEGLDSFDGLPVEKIQERDTQFGEYEDQFNNIKETLNYEFNNVDTVINESEEYELDKKLLDALNEQEIRFLNIIDESYVVAKGKKIGKNPAYMYRFDDESIQGDGFLQDPYIGVYDSDSFSKSTAMARVSLLHGTIKIIRMLNLKQE